MLFIGCPLAVTQTLDPSLSHLLFSLLLVLQVIDAILVGLGRGLVCVLDAIDLGLDPLLDSFLL